MRHICSQMLQPHPPESNACIRAGGHFFMYNNTDYPANIGYALTVAKIIKAVVSSEAEAEIWSLFLNCRKAIPVRQALKEMGHKQPPTQMQIGKTTAYVFVTNKISSKRLKSTNMRIHWLQYIALQGQFRHGNLDPPT